MKSTEFAGDPRHSAERRDQLDKTIAIVTEILEGMEIREVSPESIIAAPPDYDGEVLLNSTGQFNLFVGQLAVRLRFIGYPFDKVAFLSVRQLCEMYLDDSYPSPPTAPLEDDEYELRAEVPRRTLDGNPKDFPICFVLGAPRSGTTLLRAMLNVHPTLWAPGELHFAHYATLADRAHDIAPLLRDMPIPECAERRKEPIASFTNAFRNWERKRTPLTDVYEALHLADPETLIVDKSPTYSQQLRYLERIGEQFPNARFIHLVRSPHDVIRSFVRLQLQHDAKKLFQSPRNPYHVAEAIWYACNANPEAFLRGIEENRKYTVRYEDLVLNPDDSLTQVCDLLDRSFDSRMANPYANTSGAVVQGAGDLHIHLLGAVEQRQPIEAFYPLGGKSVALAERFGY